jgi:CRP/FNR family transcriptional regulator
VTAVTVNFVDALKGLLYPRPPMDMTTLPGLEEALAMSRLSKLPPAKLAALLALGQPIEIPRGKHARQPGDPARLCLVVEGILRVYISDDKRQLTTRYHRQGDLIGALQLLQPVESNHIVALTPCRGWTAEGEKVKALAFSDAEVLRVLAEDTAHRFQEFHEELATLAFGSLRKRVARHVLDLAQLGEDGRLVCAANQTELANAIGSVREVVARTLREFKQEGLVAVEREGIVVVDPAKLYAESEAAGSASPLAARA